MTFVFLFSGRIQEEAHQDPQKWKCLKGIMGCRRQAIVSPVKEISKEETRGILNGQKLSFGALVYFMKMKRQKPCKINSFLWTNILQTSSYEMVEEMVCSIY